MTMVVGLVAGLVDGTVGAAQAQQSAGAPASVGLISSSGVLAPMAPAETWGGGSPVEHCLDCDLRGLAGVPAATALQDPNVDPQNGDFTLADPLFTAPATGGDLSVSLTYDAEAAQAAQQASPSHPGPFGWGWAGSTFPSIQIAATTVTVHAGNGSAVTFTQTLTGTCPGGDSPSSQRSTVPGSATAYCAPARVDAQLGFFATTGTYQVADQGGTQVETYDSLGRIIASGTLGNTNDVVYSYNVAAGTNGCPSGQPNSCTIARETTAAVQTVFVLSAAGQVQSVIDPTNGHGSGRAYQLGYDALNELHTLTDPSGAVETFTYVGPNHELATVTNADNATRWITANSSGMVTDVTDWATSSAAAHHTLYGYQNVNCGTGSCLAIGQGQRTTVTHPDGEVDVATYTSGLLVSDSYGSSDPTSPLFQANAYNYSFPTALARTAPTTLSLVHVGPTVGTLTTTVTVDPVGNVLSLLDAAGRLTTNLWNDTGANTLDELCWSAGPGVAVPPVPTCGMPPVGASASTYDAWGDVQTRRDPLGNTTTTAYRNPGMPCWQADPVVANVPSQPTCANPPVGATLTAYNLQGLAVQATVGYESPAAQTTSSTYDADGGILTSTDGNGNTTRYSYDAVGRLTSTTLPNGSVTQYTLDAVGNVLAETDQAGTTTTTYDADNRMCWRSRGTVRAAGTCTSPAPAGSVSIPGYLAGTTAPLQAVDANGNVTLYTYGDVAYPTQPTREQDPAGTAVTFTTYDDLGRTCVTGPVPASTCAPTAGDTFSLFDKLGNPVQSTNPDLNTTFTTYGNPVVASSPTSVTDPLGHLTSYGYDADGRPIWSQDPAGNVQSTGYDADSRPCWTAVSTAPLATPCTAPPQGSGDTSTGYDTAGVAISVTDNVGPGSVTSVTTHDADNNTLSVSDENGRTVGYQYNAANQVICVAYPVVAGSSCRNPAGPANTTVTNGYDPAGRQTSTTDWKGNVVGYGYSTDGKSLLTSTTYPTAGTPTVLTDGYDNAGNLTAANYSGKVNNGQGNSWTYNTDDMVKSTSQISGFQSTDTYATRNWVQSAANPTNAQGGATTDTYGYNPDGSVRTDTPAARSPINFTYNTGSELTATSNPTTGVTSTYASNADGQRCWQASAVVATPSCTAAPAGSTSYRFNGSGLLCWSGPTVNATAACSAPPAGVTSYGYSADGLRKSETSPTSAQLFTWDTVSGGSIPRIIEDGAASAPNAYIYGPGGTAPAEQIVAGTVDFLAQIPSGVQTVFTQAGAVLDETGYSTYGPPTQSATPASPFGYDGAYTDATGLLYLVNRYYDPATDQFISVDPLVATTGQPYAFVDGNPLNETDPLGLCGWRCHLQRAAAVITHVVQQVAPVVQHIATQAAAVLVVVVPLIADVVTPILAAAATAACTPIGLGPVCGAAISFVVGAGVGAYVYGLTPGTHTARGYLHAAVQGGWNSLVGWGLGPIVDEVSPFDPVFNGALSYGLSPGPHTASGYLIAGAEGGIGSWIDARRAVRGMKRARAAINPPAPLSMSSCSGFC